MTRQLAKVQNINSRIVSVGSNRQKRHAVSNLEPMLQIRPQFYNFSGPLTSSREGDRDRIKTLALFDIAEIDTRIGDLDENLVGLECGAWDGGGFEDGGVAVLVHADCADCGVNHFFFWLCFRKDRV